MQFLSCAPNCVDVLLWRALKEVSNGFYVDFSPIADTPLSVTRTFYNLGWRGINVHQDPKQCELFGVQRPQDAHIWVPSANQLAGTWCEQVALKENIHFAHLTSDSVIDAFGGDHWKSTRPWVLVIEVAGTQNEDQAATDGSSDWGSGQLLSSGYRFAYTDGRYWLCVADEHTDLLDKLKQPPNIFDDFKLGVDPALLKVRDVSANNVNSYLESVMAAQKSAARARAAVQQLRLSVLTLNAELQAVQNELQTLRVSTSWKITLPLRLLVTFLRIDLPRMLRCRVGILLQQFALGLDKNPKVARAVRRLADRLPSLKRLLLRFAGVVVSDGDRGSEIAANISLVGEFDAMPVRAQQIYADLQAATSNKDKG